MGYLQMQLMNETTETSTIGICLNTHEFIDGYPYI